MSRPLLTDGARPDVDYCLFNDSVPELETVQLNAAKVPDMFETVVSVPVNVKGQFVGTLGVKVSETLAPDLVPVNWPPLLLLGDEGNNEDHVPRKDEPL